MPGNSDIDLERDPRLTNRRVWYREPLVMITVICLMVLSGITTNLQNVQITRTEPASLRILYRNFSSILAGPTILMSVFLSDYKGRKPVIIFLFILSILTSIIYSFPLEGTRLILTLMVQGIVSGGTLAMTTIVILEYCSSKNKLVYLIANMAVWQGTEYSLKTVLYAGNVYRNDSTFLRAFPSLLALVCLISTWIWPESPYWLASKDRIEESRRALLWLRGEEGEEELQALLRRPRGPGPPKHYFLSCLITVFTVSFYEITVWQDSYINAGVAAQEFNTALIVCCSFGIVCLGIVIFNNVKRKLMFLAVASLPLAVYYFYDSTTTLVGPRIIVKPNKQTINPFMLKVFDSVLSIIRYSNVIVLGLSFLAMTALQKNRLLLYAINSCFFLFSSAMVLIRLYFLSTYIS